MRTVGSTLVIVLSALVLLVACGGDRPGYSSASQAADGVTIMLERPANITPLQDYEFFVTLTDGSGKPLDGATVFLEQDMPGMPMGSNQPLGEALGNGQYRIRGVFTMDGKWVVKVHAMVGGNEHIASFDQEVNLPK